jgi:hypothetical protein
MRKLIRCWLVLSLISVPLTGCGDSSREVTAQRRAKAVAALEDDAKAGKAGIAADVARVIKRERAQLQGFLKALKEVRAKPQPKDAKATNNIQKVSDAKR